MKAIVRAKIKSRGRHLYPPTDLYFNSERGCGAKLLEGNSRLLEGKKAIITGAGKGIGKEVALAFAQNGASLIATSRTKKDLDELSAEANSKFPHKLQTLVSDVSSNEEVSQLVKDSIQMLGGLDTIVCAAGYPLRSELWDINLHELQDSDFKNVFDIDLLGSFRVAKEALPHFMSKRSGVIIFFSSTPALAGYDKGAPYTVAKAAILGLTKDIASEYGSFGIRCYAVAPGNIKTDATFERLSEDVRNALAAESSMKRWGDASEVANVCVSLASDNMSFVTGQTIVIDGGTVML
jgi:3-oxoacyl-[acyl-carrier protein] reductase